MKKKIFVIEAIFRLNRIFVESTKLISMFIKMAITSVKIKVSTKVNPVL